MAGLSTGNSEIPGGLEVPRTNGFNGQEQLRAAAPVLVQLYEGLAVAPEAGQTRCLSRGLLPRDAAAC